MSWQSRVVAELARRKADGMTFDAAWIEALRLHPPSGRDRGFPATDLFEAAREGEGLTAFFRRACDDAWHGRQPALRHLVVLLEAEVPGPEAVQGLVVRVA